MYIPTYYREENIDAIRAFISENSFAILISQVYGKPWATHIPLLLDKGPNGKDILFGHISKANKQWKEFKSDEEILVVFSGSHSYISPSCYDHMNVPTWNYVAVHIYGKLNIIEGDKLRNHLGKLINKYESDVEKPVHIDNIPKEYIAKEMRGIIGFEIEISEIQCAKKLSQDKSEQNHKNIIKELERNGDSNSKEIAKLMKKETEAPN